MMFVLSALLIVVSAYALHLSSQMYAHGRNETFHANMLEVMDVFDIGVGVVNVSGQSNFNGILADFIGKKTKALSEVSIDEIIHIVEQKLYLGNLPSHQILNNKKAFCVICVHEGREYFFQTKAQYSMIGDVVRWDIVLINTEPFQQRMDDKLQKNKLQAVSQLAGAVAHDFNNILSIIEGYVRLLEKKKTQIPDALFDYIQRIDSASGRAKSLAQKLMNFGRYQMKSHEIVGLKDVVEDCASELNSIVSVNHKIRYGLDTGLHIAIAPGVLKELLKQLVLNASQAMQGEGEISVIGYISSQEEYEGYVCLEVADTGDGMEKDILSQIYDPFFSTKRAAGHSGLGLSIVNNCMHQIGGFISVCSEPSQGTSVRLFFPRSFENTTYVSKTISSKSGQHAFHGFHVLVVDDESELRAVLKPMLIDAGFDVLEAANGNKALAVLDDHIADIDIILTDIVMPELDGVSFAKMAVSLKPSVKVVFMSGYPERHKSSYDGIFARSVCLSKPVDPKILLEAMHDALQNNSDADDEKYETATWQ